MKKLLMPQWVFATAALTVALMLLSGWILLTFMPHERPLVRLGANVIQFVGWISLIAHSGVFSHYARLEKEREEREKEERDEPAGE